MEDNDEKKSILKDTNRFSLLRKAEMRDEKEESDKTRTLYLFLSYRIRYG